MEKLLGNLDTYLKETKILDSEFFLLTNGKWLFLFLLLLVGFVLQKLLQALWPKLFAFTKKTITHWDDQLVDVSKTYAGRIFAGLFWYVGIRIGHFGDSVEHGLLVGVRLYISLNIILFVYNSIDVLVGVIKASTKVKGLPIDDQVFVLLQKTLKVFVIIFGFLVMVQNFGINVMSLLAGLGLGGLAIALAAQDTCANFFGSIMILLDRPFRIGDIIKVSGIEGTVEDIGFRSTKIRTFYGSLITVPNAEMAKSHIDNLGVRLQRRVRFQLGVEYSTKPALMKEFIEGIKKVVAANELVDSDNITVVFENYGDFSLNILLNFFLNVRDIKGELSEKEKILLEIYALADTLKIGFAFPTQTIHLSKPQL